jgi:hypothetical protein
MEGLVERPSGLIKRAREQALSEVLVELLDEVENVAREPISAIDLNCYKLHNIYNTYTRANNIYGT